MSLIKDNDRAMLDKLALEMTEYYSGDPLRIQHFMKVHAYSALIARLEGLGDRETLILEVAAYTHDIGIKPAEKMYGSSNGKLQEKLGPPVARDMLGKLGFDDELTERVCAMIAHHHTYTDIDSTELQILIEADFIVNLFEDGADADSIRTTIRKIFRTGSGTRLAETIFAVDPAKIGKQ